MMKSLKEMDSKKRKEMDSGKGCVKKQRLVSKAKAVSKQFFFKDLFIHERHTERERGRDKGRGKNRLHSGSPTWDLILGLQDYTPG